MNGKKEIKTSIRRTERKLPISNAFDSYGAFLEFHEVKTFGKLELSLLVKIDTKNLVPQKLPPMLDIMSRLHDVLCRSPINDDHAFIFKGDKLSLNPLSQTKRRET